MADERNPTSSAILQALLDLEGAGFKTNVGPVIAKLQSDKKLLQDLEARFRQRGYNQNKVSFTQLTINQNLMLLGEPAFKVLMFLGMYSSQDGMVGVKLDTLKEACCLSKSTVQRAVKELMACGLLAQVDGAKRHEPAIWQVHPGVIHSGKRQFQKHHEDAFFKRITAPKDAYLLGKTLPLVVQQDGVYRKLPTGETLYFLRLDLVPPTKKEPSTLAGSNDSDDF